jgi:hypothetical protein
MPGSGGTAAGTTCTARRARRGARVESAPADPGHNVLVRQGDEDREADRGRGVGGGDSAPRSGADADAGADQFDPGELRELSGYARLAQRLKEAHAVLRAMDLDVPERADFVRRLLVITAASRHDQDDAMRRLGRFLQALDENRGGGAGPDPEA